MVPSHICNLYLFSNQYCSVFISLSFSSKSKCWCCWISLFHIHFICHWYHYLIPSYVFQLLLLYCEVNVYIINFLLYFCNICLCIDEFLSKTTCLSDAPFSSLFGPINAVSLVLATSWCPNNLVCHWGFYPTSLSCCLLKYIFLQTSFKILKT